MAAQLATLLDLEALLQRKLADKEEVAADQALTFASAQLRQRVPSLQRRIDAGTVDRDLVAGVVVAAVVRSLRSGSAPEGVVQESAGSVSRTYSDRGPSVAFTADELALLAPGSGTTRGRPRSVQLGWRC